MIYVRSSRTLRTLPFLRSSSFSSHQPNAPLDLDNSFRVILRDVDNSISEQKLKRHHPSPELSVYPTVSQSTELAHRDDEDEGSVRAERKSPAAHFGSQQLGAVVIPRELQQRISSLISGETIIASWVFLDTYNV
jgi:hypothetical protein